MNWTDDALLLSARPHGESALLVTLLTREHGRHAGLVTGGQSKRHRPSWQTGTLMAVKWQARRAEHLGTVSGEPRTPYAARWLDDPFRLAGVSAACAVSEACLPERVPHAPAFEALVALFDGLSEAHWPSLYAHWELGLLGELGFGLDLGVCAATGASADLVYVSPKSGRAVSRGAGAEYHDRLLPLPAFLKEGVTEDRAAVAEALALTGFFLERHVLAPHGRSLPPARSRLVDRLRA
jgi:DNA repair protein RecO (recombination protein O)